MRVALSLLALIFASGTTFAQSRIEADHAAVATSSPLATRAALETIASGGSAADAAVAAAFVIAADQSAACGLGGGGALLYYDRDSGTTRALSFTPARTNSIYTEESSVVPARTPGFVAGLELLHETFGRRSWEELVSFAASLARERGNDPLASTLSRISSDADSFHRGALADSVGAAAREASIGVTERDLETYRARWLAPVRVDYGPYQVYSLLPPEGAGTAFAETLFLMAGFELGHPVDSAEFAHALMMSSRQALEDDAELIRARAAGGRMPFEELLRRDRIDRIREELDTARANPGPSLSVRHGSGSSLVVVDSSMNIVTAVLPSCGCDAPASLDTLGFDICTGESAAGRDIAALPLVILEEGRPWVAVVGSDGFGDLPSTMQILFGLARNGSLERLMNLPRVSWNEEGSELYFESSGTDTPLIEGLSRAGYAMISRSSIGALNIVHWNGARLIAISDPRGKGAAGGY